MPRDAKCSTGGAGEHSRHAACRHAKPPARFGAGFSLRGTPEICEWEIRGTRARGGRRGCESGFEHANVVGLSQDHGGFRDPNEEAASGVPLGHVGSPLASAEDPAPSLGRRHPVAGCADHDTGPHPGDFGKDLIRADGAVRIPRGIEDKGPWAHEQELLSGVQGFCVRQGPPAEHAQSAGGGSR